jgi:phage terminase small subunit
VEDANAAIEYAGCATKHAEVTGLYNLWRQRLIEFIDELRSDTRE